MALLLEQANCTVTLCHSRTRDLPAMAGSADIVVAAVGRAELIRGDWIREGAVVIDVGVNRQDDGSLVGDVAFAEASERAAAITPVPGGVGPMTIAMLMREHGRRRTGSWGRYGPDHRPGVVMSNRRTPLYDQHIALGARMVPFAGFDMPVQYAGLASEHQAVRERAGLFDVSHMGEVRVRGPRAAATLQRLLSNAVLRVVPGQAQYNLMCNERGGVVDDTVIYKIADDDFLVCANASNRAKDFAWIQQNNPHDDVSVEDEGDAWVQFAIQGPSGPEITARLSAPIDSGPRARTASPRGRSPASMAASSRGPATPARTGSRCSLRLNTVPHCGTRSSRRAERKASYPWVSARATPSGSKHG